MDKNDTILRNEVLATSQQWIAHFNRGDVDACLAGYLPDAVMEVTPMGSFRGTQEIENFWRPFMTSGATNLEYQDITIEIMSHDTVHLAADWRMNVGRGIITLEKWVKQPSGQWLLAHDAFEVLEQFPHEP